MMSPQTILVHLDGRARGTETLKVACRIAKNFHSHVATVFATQPPLLVASAMDPAAAVVLEYQAEAELAQTLILQKWGLTTLAFHRALKLIEDYPGSMAGQRASVLVEHRRGCRSSGSVHKP